MKKIFLFFCFLTFTCSIIGQKKDYTKIKFKSKLRHYTKIQPKTKELGINKELFTDIVNLLAFDIYTENQKKEFTNKLWLAVSNPKKFDYVYKDFSLNSIKNWGVKIKFKDPNFEPNPYLEKWTNTGDEFLYFQWTTTRILTHIKLMDYGGDGLEAAKSIRNLALLKGLKFPKSTENEYTYDYLSLASSTLKSKGLVLLIYNNHYDFTVCKIEDKNKLIALFDKLKWEFVAL
ncbi:MAG: hypothetical protein L3J08_05925 [Flavobacteriaceae bacterium]|nr:hypothetical protein [Flavobacteriaceae bacterium]